MTPKALTDEQRVSYLTKLITAGDALAETVEAEHRRDRIHTQTSAYCKFPNCKAAREWREARRSARD